MLFVGDDWAEDHHDVHLMDEAGAVIARRRLPEGLAGIRALHELIADHAETPAEVVKAPAPADGARLTIGQITAALRRGGRQRNLQRRAEEIHAALRGEQLAAPAAIVDAFAATTKAAVAIIAELNRQIQQLEASLTDRFEQHPDADIYRSLPGLGVVLGARALGEFA